jgi:hypothetical protein
MIEEVGDRGIGLVAQVRSGGGTSGAGEEEEKGGEDGTKGHSAAKP